MTNSSFIEQGVRNMAGPAYRPFLAACYEHGISKTVAYELVKAGLIDTFKLGVKRYVIVESLRTLPDRLGKAGAA